MRNLVVSASLIVGVALGVTPHEAVSADPDASARAQFIALPESGSLADFRSDSGFGAVMPISIDAGEVVVDVSINGRGPFPFIFDTGAQDALTPETVAALGLKNRRCGNLTGQRQSQRLDHLHSGRSYAPWRRRVKGSTFFGGSLAPVFDRPWKPGPASRLHRLRVACTLRSPSRLR
jgi:hypothetical protein